MNVKFLDLKKQYLSLKEEINQALARVVESQMFVMGEEVTKFEEEFAKFNNTKYAVGVSSGTSALHLALSAVGVQGSEVITVPNTFIATAAAITAAGGKTKFVDIDAETHLMDIEKLKEAINPKTKAIVPVHLYGLQAEMKAIKDIAEDHNLIVIEDAAQAHGSLHEGKAPGYYGEVACFSFFPAKNLGAYGDAGACVTNNEQLAERIGQLRNQGRKKGDKYLHVLEGHNHRLDEIQAAVLRAKLRYLQSWVDLRRKHAKHYNQNLKNIVEIQKCNPDEHAYHLYVIKTPKREVLKDHLKNQGIEAGVHYPVPLHLQPAYQHLNLRKGSFPIAEKNAEQILSLPMFPELKKEETDYVIEKVLEFMQ